MKQFYLLLLPFLFISLIVTSCAPASMLTKSQEDISLESESPSDDSSELLIASAEEVPEAEEKILATNYTSLLLGVWRKDNTEKYLFEGNNIYYCIKNSSSLTADKPVAYAEGEWQIVENELRLTPTRELICLFDEEGSSLGYEYEIHEISSNERAESAYELIRYSDEKIKMGGSFLYLSEADRIFQSPNFMQFKNHEEIALPDAVPERTIIDNKQIGYTSFWDEDTILLASSLYGSGTWFASYDISTEEYIEVEIDYLDYSFEANRLLVYTKTEIEIYSLPSYVLEKSLPLPKEVQNVEQYQTKLAISLDEQWLAFTGKTNDDEKAVSISFYNFETKQIIVKKSPEMPKSEDTREPLNIGFDGTTIRNITFLEDNTAVYVYTWMMAAGEWVDLASTVGVCKPEEEPLFLEAPYGATSVLNNGKQVIFSAPSGAYSYANQKPIYTIHNIDNPILEELSMTNQLRLGTNKDSSIIVALNEKGVMDFTGRTQHTMVLYSFDTLEPYAEYVVSLNTHIDDELWSITKNTFAISPDGKYVVFPNEDSVVLMPLDKDQ